MFSLREKFGKEVKITYDETWYHEKNKTEEDELWLQEIVGVRGKIYPQSQTTVTVCCTPVMGRKLMALYGSKAVFKRRGDIEFEFIIPVDCARTAFRYIKARKRKTLNPVQKAAAIARLSKFWPQHRAPKPA